jgi:hypothetical protein
MYPPKKKSAGFPGQPPEPMDGGSAPVAGGPSPGPLSPIALKSPGMPKPGQGMDPMQAMLNGNGSDPFGQGSAPPGPPVDQTGLPYGGSLPAPSDNDGDETMGGSDLLQALAGTLAGQQGGPYAQPPGTAPLIGPGHADPNLGIEPLINLLALAQLGVGGNPQPGAGSSGIDVPDFHNMGLATLLG